MKIQDRIKIAFQNGPIRVVDVSDKKTVELYQHGFGYTFIKFQVLDPELYKEVVEALQPHIEQLAREYPDVPEVYITFAHLRKGVGGYYIAERSWGLEWPTHIVIDWDLLEPERWVDMIGVMFHEFGHHLQHCGRLPREFPQPMRFRTTLPTKPKEAELIADGFMLMYVTPEEVGYTWGMTERQRKNLVKKVMGLLRPIN